MTASLRMTKLTDMVALFQKMEMCMKANGSMIKLKDSEHKEISKEAYTLAIGSIINKAALEKKNGQTALDTKEDTWMEKNTAKES